MSVPKTKLEEKNLVQRVQRVLNNRASMAKSFGKNFAHYARNPQEKVTDPLPHQPKITTEEVSLILEQDNYEGLLKAAAVKGAAKARRGNQSAAAAKKTIIKHVAKAHVKYIHSPGNKLRFIGGAAVAALPPFGLLIAPAIAKQAQRLDRLRSDSVSSIFTKHTKSAVHHGMQHYLKGV
jgi:hypothetical protein